jgi:hypothetical protein
LIKDYSVAPLGEEPQGRNTLDWRIILNFISVK